MFEIYLYPDEAKNLEGAAGSPRNQLLIRLLCRSGSSIRDALALPEPDIDFQQGTVTIHRLRVPKKLSCPHCGTELRRSDAFCTECGNKVEEKVAQAGERRPARTWPLDSDTLEMLRRYINDGGPVSSDGQ